MLCECRQRSFGQTLGNTKVIQSNYLVSTCKITLHENILGHFDSGAFWSTHLPSFLLSFFDVTI
jgi:hypothetical protein